MNLLRLLIIILLTGGIMTTQANTNDAPLKIRSLFNIKKSFCAIRTNGTLGLNNRSSAYSGRGGGISSTNSLLFLENGKNEISLEIGALGWFSDKTINDTEREKFDKDAGCKLELVRFNNEKRTSLASIQVIINNEGVPVSISGEEKDIIRSKILAEQAEPGHFDVEYFDARYFPKNMTLYRFSQSINITDIPIWEWTKAPPFTGSAEQINGLKNAYTKMANIINRGDREELKKYNRIALKAWSKTTGDSEDSILESQYSKKDLEGGKIKINPINWNDYSVRIMNHARIVQFYNKSKPSFSPLSYYTIDEDGDDYLGSLSPMFSLINGEFVPVI